jgi:hypothetical protein
MNLMIDHAVGIPTCLRVAPEHVRYVFRGGGISNEVIFRHDGALPLRSPCVLVPIGKLPGTVIENLMNANLVRPIRDARAVVIRLAAYINKGL